MDHFRDGADLMPAVMQQVLAGSGGRTEVLIDRTLGTTFGDMTNGGGLAAAFDGNTNQAASAGAAKTSSAIGYVGKTLAAPAIFSRAVIHGSNDQGYINAIGVNAVVVIMGKQGAAPSNAIDGTNLGSASGIDVADQSAGRTINSNDLATAWDHIWVRTTSGGGGVSARIAELVLYELK